MTNPDMSVALSTLVDAQVNGVWDREVIDFSHLELSPDCIRRAIRRWAEVGTHAFVPTLVTAPAPVYRHNLPLLGDAIWDWGSRALMGIHLEGPWISADDNARGAHPCEHCRPPRIEEFEEYFDLSRGTIVLVTVAPELKGAMPFIEHVTKKRGVVVSLGHHLADPGVVREAIAAGATCATHIGNACPTTLHRHSVHLLQQMVHPGLYGCFITDRRHITDEFAYYGILAKHQAGNHLPIIVSDASSAALAPPGEYDVFNGKRVAVLDDGSVIVPGVCPIKHAGSGASLVDCMNGALDLGFPPELVVKMASDNPWRLLGPSVELLLKRTRDYYAVQPGQPKVALVDGRFRVTRGE